MLTEAAYCRTQKINLAKITRCSYCVFRDGVQIGSVNRIYPEGWYFTFEGNKLPYVGRTRVEAIRSYLREKGLEVTGDE